MLDHEPLSDACESGKILPLYIIEPELWRQPDVSYRHFINLQHYLKQLDKMFIGKDTLVHAGSSVEGWQMPGVIMEDVAGEVNSNYEETQFEPDENYPY